MSIGRFNYGQAQLAGISEDLTTLLAQGPAIASTLASIIRKVGPYINTVKRVADDPALPAVIQRIETIADMETATSVASGGSPAAGVGLDKAVPILDAYIYAKQNPWAPWVVGLGIIAVIGGIGYRMGQRKGS